MTSSFDNRNNRDLSTQIDTVIKHYHSLVDHAHGRVYPIFDTAILGTRPPSFDTWSNRKKTLYRLSTPFIMLESNSDQYSVASFAIWMLSFASWYAIGTGLLQVFFGEPASTAAQTSTVQWYNYVYLGISILSILLVPVTYGRTIYFFRSKSSWKAKIVFLVSLVIMLLLALSAIQDWFPGLLRTVQQVPESRIAFLFIFFLFLVPICLYLTYMMLAGFQFMMWLINYLLKSFIATYNPYTHKVIPRIINEPVSMEGGVWKLINLPAHEIRSIREWARDNLDASEKRTAPAFWLLALIGLMANTAIFEGWLQKASVYFSEKYIEFEAQDSIFAVKPELFLIFVVGIPIALTFVILFLGIFIGLFRNISVQSAIIEACTVILYAKEKEFLEKQSVRKRSWWERIFS
jgi:hypothetical protein